MVTLPQHDSSGTRTDELAEVRSRYAWDHDYLSPFPFLKVPEVTATGLLNAADVLIGTFVGLPVEEQSPVDWLIGKVDALWLVTDELLAGDVLEDRAVRQVPTPGLGSTAKGLSADLIGRQTQCELELAISDREVRRERIDNLLCQPWCRRALGGSPVVEPRGGWTPHSAVPFQTRTRRPAVEAAERLCSPRCIDDEAPTALASVLERGRSGEEMP